MKRGHDATLLDEIVHLIFQLINELVNIVRILYHF